MKLASIALSILLGFSTVKTIKISQFTTSPSVDTGKGESSIENRSEGDVIRQNNQKEQGCPDTTNPACENYVSPSPRTFDSDYWANQAKVFCGTPETVQQIKADFKITTSGTDYKISLAQFKKKCWESQCSEIFDFINCQDGDDLSRTDYERFLRIPGVQCHTWSMTLLKSLRMDMLKKDMIGDKTITKDQYCSGSSDADTVEPKGVEKKVIWKKVQGLCDTGKNGKWKHPTGAFLWQERKKTAAYCQDKCLNNPSCTSYNFGQGGQWQGTCEAFTGKPMRGKTDLKGSVAGNLWNCNIKLSSPIKWKRIQGICATDPSRISLPGPFHYRKRDTTLDHCIKKCTDDDKCISFLFGEDGKWAGTCELFSAYPSDTGYGEPPQPANAPGWKKDFEKRNWSCHVIQ